MGRVRGKCLQRYRRSTSKCSGAGGKERGCPVEEIERLVSEWGMGVGWGGLLGNNLD